ncbi:MAG: GCN5-related N-acetyltransferase [Caulobacteraceae bacterium]|nr:GCN5-related N-acetyltransferase [Caulobacteraceae bacterium]
MRLGFRPLDDGDRDRLLGWRNSPAVAAFMYTDRQIGREEHEVWFAGIAGDARRSYWIIEIEGAPTGLANLYDIQTDHGRASWAFYLAEPSARGRGAGAYVEYRMLRHVFEHLGLHKLWCEVLVTNAGVIKLHKGFGFEQEALFRQHIRKAGEWLDVVGLGLLAQDWPDRREAAARRLTAVGYDLSTPAAL